jgi:hypothetical protein
MTVERRKELNYKRIRNYQLIFAALTVIIGFSAIYYKGNSKLIRAVTSYIAEVEGNNTNAKSGSEKMQYVVKKLYLLLLTAKSVKAIRL